MAVRIGKSSTLEPKAKAFIMEAIREILADPDFGLELTARAKRKLKISLRSKKRIPLSVILKKYT